MPPFITDMEATIYTFQVIVSTYNFTAIRHSPSRTFSMNVTVPDIVDNVSIMGIMLFRYLHLNVCMTIWLDQGGSDDDGVDMPDAIQFLLRLKLEGAVVRQR